MRGHAKIILAGIAAMVGGGMLMSMSANSSIEMPGLLWKGAAAICLGLVLTVVGGTAAVRENNSVAD